MRIRFSLILHDAGISHDNPLITVTSTAAPRLADTDDSSVQLTTSFHLLSNLSIPLVAGLSLREEWKQEAVQRSYPSEVSRGELVIVFEMALPTDSSQPSHSLHLRDVLAYHQQRERDARSEGHCQPNLEPYNRHSVFPAFLSQCPTALLASVVL